jgi:uncharacterized protein YqeY
MITKINEDLKQAMRDKNSTKLNVLRALKSAISNASIQKGNINSPISDNEIIGIVRKEISKRQDSIESFVTAKRFDLVSKETSEMELLKEYLPIEWSDEELTKAVEDAIIELGATTKKDMGNVIKKVQELAQGRVDNKAISAKVGQLL